MANTDSRGIHLSTKSSQAIDDYERALDLTASYFVDPLASIDTALAREPDFVSGHCLRAALGVLAIERGALPLLRESVEAGARLARTANERERRHFGAAQAWLDGDFHRANAIYGQIVIDYPRDLLALQVAHITDFALGQQRLLRDRVAQVLPEWSPGTPGFGYVLGMLAFGLEETNLFERAEAAGRQALELNPRDPWAVHALTHCYETTGRYRTGSTWLESVRGDWAPDNALAYHNFWHLALFRIEAGDLDAALALFDEQVWPKQSGVALEMVDASSLLWRLHLRGVDVAARAARLADTWSDVTYQGYYAFNDAHAAMAFVLAGRLEAARLLVRELERCVGDDGSNALMTREVALPLARAFVDFGEERYAEVTDALLPLRQVAQRFGGSNAQRDVIDRTLLEAAIRAGKPRLVAALQSERRLLRRA